MSWPPLAELAPRPGNPFASLLATEEPAGNGITEAPADEVGDIVTGQSADCGERHDQRERQMASGGDYPRRDHRSLTRHNRQDRVEQGQHEYHRVSPSRRIRDQVGELVKHESARSASQGERTRPPRFRRPRGRAVLAILTCPEPTVGSFSLTLLAGYRFQRMFPPWPERDQGRSEDRGITAANPAELDELVRISTWSESCYASAHSTDDELANGIMAVYTTIDGGTDSL